MTAESTLNQDHRELGAILSAIFAALETHNSELNILIDFFWARLAVHIRAEHRQLFPKLIDAARSSNSNADENSQLEKIIDKLRADHDIFMTELAKLVAETRAETIDRAAIRSRLEELSDRLSIHDRTEEAIIYPRVESLMPGPVAAELKLKIQAELENMPARFVEGQ